MKFSNTVTSSRRRNRKMHFTAGEKERRLRMSSTLSKELRLQHGFRTIPVKKNDEVEVMSGDLRGKKGKVIDVKRAIYKVFLDIGYREKKNGQVSRFGIHPSNLKIISLAMEDGRMKIIERKKNARAESEQKKTEAAARKGAVRMEVVAG
jgi:large subunit ribosomal protein L26e